MISENKIAVIRRGNVPAEERPGQSWSRDTLRHRIREKFVNDPSGFFPILMRDEKP